MSTVIRDVVVLGGGSAGLIAALTLKRRLPHLSIRVVRSQDIGVIGVGEGTTQLFPKFFFDYLKLKPAQFYQETQPTWKLGIKFIWGPRRYFHYTFSSMMDQRWPELPRNHGFYCDDDCEALDLWSALMAEGKAFPRTEGNKPEFFRHAHVGFHVENRKLVAYLEARCRDFGVQIIDGTVSKVVKGAQGIAQLLLENGASICADLFIDSSGFRSELLGRALEVPFRSYDSTLFCDRAVIGGWPRTDEPILPYTVAETMDAGWSWQIEHEAFINRGYVYSSRFISDEAAQEEFLRKNPKVANQPRVVKFRTGRFCRMWVGNVVGIGNASGFVEPLEASALQVIIIQSRTLADILSDSLCEVPASTISLYNQFICQAWDDVRDFLAVHYRFNTRLDTPFWTCVRNEVALEGAESLVSFYRENGPSGIGRTVLLNQNNPYGLEGYYAMLIGQKVPHAKPYRPSDAERRTFESHRRSFITLAKRGFCVKQSLECIRRPGWSWS